MSSTMRNQLQKITENFLSSTMLQWHRLHKRLPYLFGVFNHAMAKYIRSIDYSTALLFRAIDHATMKYTA